MGMANKLKIYQAREQSDKDYEEDIFKNIKHLDAQLTDYFKKQDETLDTLDPKLKSEFSGVTKHLRELR